MVLPNALLSPVIFVSNVLVLIEWDLAFTLASVLFGELSCCSNRLH